MFETRPGHRRVCCAVHTSQHHPPLLKGVPADPGTRKASQRGKDRRSVVDVDNRSEIRDFLTSRRGRITPEQAGLPAYGGRRRVSGLRREEVALLAGVSVDQYTRLERGDIKGGSDWPTAANDIVAALRAEAGKNPYDRELSDLVGELSTRSDEFATRCAAQNMRFHRSGFKDIHHPIVGDLHLTFEVMDLPADPGLSLIVCNAEPGSGSVDSLKLLASWTANEEEPAAARSIDQLP